MALSHTLMTSELNDTRMTSTLADITMVPRIRLSSRSGAGTVKVNLQKGMLGQTYGSESARSSLCNGVEIVIQCPIKTLAQSSFLALESFCH